MTGEFTKVATTGDIPVGGMKAFELKHQRIVLVRTEEGFFALADECSHDSAPISGGRVRGDQIVCPRHGARFNVRTGEVTAPPAVIGIDRFEVRIDGDDVLVKLD